MKNNILLFLAVIALGAGSYYSERQFLSHSPTPANTTALAAQVDTLPARASLPARVRSQAGTHAGGQSQGVTLAALNATTTKSTDINFTLSVGGQNYRGHVLVGATILDAMRALSSSSDFRFISKDFPGMGMFVESINGLPAQAGKVNAGGFYWILYVNGTSSQTGASQTSVHANDSLEWRYESR